MELVIDLHPKQTKEYENRDTYLKGFYNLHELLKAFTDLWVEIHKTKEGGNSVLRK